MLFTNIIWERIIIRDNISLRFLNVVCTYILKVYTCYTYAIYFTFSDLLILLKTQFIVNSIARDLNTKQNWRVLRVKSTSRLFNLNLNHCTRTICNVKEQSTDNKGLQIIKMRQSEKGRYFKELLDLARHVLVSNISSIIYNSEDERHLRNAWTFPVVLTLGIDFTNIRHILRKCVISSHGSAEPCHVERKWDDEAFIPRRGNIREARSTNI